MQSHAKCTVSVMCLFLCSFFSFFAHVYNTGSCKPAGFEDETHSARGVTPKSRSQNEKQPHVFYVCLSLEEKKNGFTLPSGGLQRTRSELDTTFTLCEYTVHPGFGFTLQIHMWILTKVHVWEDLTVFWFLSNNRKRGWAAAGWSPQDVAWLGGSQTSSSNFRSTQLMLWKRHKTALFASISM